MWLSRGVWRCRAGVVAGVVVALTALGLQPAQAAPTPTPTSAGRGTVAPAKAAAGARPVVRPVPLTSRPLHGRASATRTEPEPPRASTRTWSSTARPAAKTVIKANVASTVSHAGPTDVYAVPGDRIADTSLVVYFNVPDSWSGLGFTLYDATTNKSITFPLSPPPAPAPYCPQQTYYCFTILSSYGWPLQDGHSYYATVTVYYSDGTGITVRSNSAPARFTPKPPGLTVPQTFGCSCANSSGRTAARQDMVHDPVNTATGAFSETATDEQLPGFGVLFTSTRSYSQCQGVGLFRGW